MRAPFYKGSYKIVKKEKMCK